jgi:hypothetical protein
MANRSVKRRGVRLPRVLPPGLNVAALRATAAAGPSVSAVVLARLVVGVMLGGFYAHG